MSFLLNLLIYTHLLSIPTDDVTITISGLESSKGKVEIGIYNSSSTFPKSNEFYKGYSISPNGSEITISVNDLPEGTYAIAVWHDENEDKKLNTNWVGKPSEKYGFSNNVFGVFSPPNFDEASFNVEKNKLTELNIKLK
ncbi:DUF2141 domain-containing protein [Flammeovirga yaeyamensis]|uniref:DUF2141 domain-containing protein n=1 Tax=Flammeovirga yaeyamensis TaxID=367791 RepID=A0AAX1N1Z2_9BACT|nr:DUF2141 domain-containing protein [Flammeovirga yaeyamensis]MBB3698117.1 uncharacterized protein (DUF2141 family) [Flammeovirga yaeyamensis]NMF34524.1 DUF2141 domain-containing protein [Flammeovirga yaeyamensis]QWG01501.1 DUF2141 domain-containing protein [Flammeovirga yaeyamensis]